MRDPIERLIYQSRALWPAPENALDSILAASVAANARSGVTGALGFSGASYVQLLEGSPQALDALMGKLLADPRHTDLVVLTRSSAGARLVPGWSMARVDLAQVSPRVSSLLANGDGLGLMNLMANLVHGGFTDVV
jgi:hypothetical protein